MATRNTTGNRGVHNPDWGRLDAGEVGGRALEQAGSSGEDSVSQPSDLRISPCGPASAQLRRDFEKTYGHPIGNRLKAVDFMGGFELHG